MAEGNTVSLFHWTTNLFYTSLSLPLLHSITQMCPLDNNSKHWPICWPILGLCQMDDGWCWEVGQAKLKGGNAQVMVNSITLLERNQEARMEKVRVVRKPDMWMFLWNAILLCPRSRKCCPWHKIIAFYLGERKNWWSFDMGKDNDEIGINNSELANNHVFCQQEKEMEKFIFVHTACIRT